MSQCTVTRCEVSTGDGMRLCYDHYDETATALLTAGDWAAVVDETLTRQDAQGQSSKVSGSREKPLPFHAGASETLTHLKAVLISWTLLVHEEKPAPLDCKDEIESLGAYLHSHMDWLRKHPAANDLHAEATDAIRRCERAVDRAEQRVFAGMCPTCAEPVYAKPGAVMVRCKVCLEEWDATEWRTRALDYAGYTAGTPAELSRMLSDPVTGETLPAGTIRSWISRKELKSISMNQLGKPVYQTSEVQELWSKTRESTQTKRNAG